MKPGTRITPMKSRDFDAVVSDIAASIWNQLIEKPTFREMKLSDFPDIFEAVGRSLQTYRQKRG
jgi:hypothetical protein